MAKQEPNTMSLNIDGLANSGPKELRGGTFDVYNGYRWCALPPKDAPVPYIQIREFQQTKGSLKAALNWMKDQYKSLKSTNRIDPYAALYTVKNKPGAVYKLPYFSDYNHMLNTTWGGGGRKLTKKMNEALDVLEDLGSLFAPNAGIEIAQAYEGTALANYSFTFTLFNTLGENDLKLNSRFISTIIHNNLINRFNAFALEPPAICLIAIPGIRGETIGYISNLDIKNIGQMTLMNDPGTGLPAHSGKVNIPDAWEITISITELLLESRQIYAQGTHEGANGAGGIVDVTMKTGNELGSAVSDVFSRIGGGASGGL